MFKAALIRTSVFMLLLPLLAGCPSSEPEPPEPPSTDEVATLEEAQEFLDEAAKRERERFREGDFEAFQAAVFKEPFEGGKIIVNGDTPILNEKQLEEFFETRIRSEPEPGLQEIILHQVGGLDASWNESMQGNLSYCVSTEFGERHADVAAEMEAATSAWEAAANVDFIHAAEEDGNCTATNANVVFDVRPVDVDGRYLARAFFPNEPRGFRNVLIDESSFELSPGSNLQLVGILRHELGHTLGFRHEHTRAESGACFEDTDWRPVGDYDPFSVMHYPQCNGLGDWSLTLTEMDRNGAACVYGPAAGFTIDTEICEPERDGEEAAGEPQTVTFSDQSVAAGEEKQYDPFPVAAGSLFEASIRGGSGDPDLYVRFGAEPLPGVWHCRPFLVGPDEDCEIDVPADAALTFVMVRGWTEGTYDLEVTHTPPGE